MRVTVCQMRCDSETEFQQDWEALIAHLRAERSDFVLLPEMPFHPWLASARTLDQAAWDRNAAIHAASKTRLGELGVDLVLATQPIVDGGENFNEGFVWTSQTDRMHGVHRKCYLPDEGGFWEAKWYQPGNDFEIFDTAQVTASPNNPRLGFAICTELWFFDHARTYGENGAHLIASPRATLDSSTDKWIAGGRSSAVVSGAYSLSSNWAGAAQAGRWGGTGWIIEPEEGEVLGTTSDEDPFLTCEIDLARAEHAKGTYPRYVPAR